MAPKKWIAGAAACATLASAVFLALVIHGQGSRSPRLAVLPVVGSPKVAAPPNPAPLSRRVAPSQDRATTTPSPRHSSGPAAPSAAPSWASNYGATGSIRVAYSQGVYAGQVPRFFQSSFVITSKGSSRGWVDIQGSQSGYATGIQLLCEDSSCARSDGFQITLPIAQSGQPTSLTFGVPLKSPLAWLTLPIGAHSSQVTANDRYEVELRRPSAKQWVFDVSTHPGGPGPFEFMRTGRVQLDVNSVRPAWTKMTFNVDISGSAGSARGSWTLTRLRPGQPMSVFMVNGTPTPSPGS